MVDWKGPLQLPVRVSAGREASFRRVNSTGKVQRKVQPKVQPKVQNRFASLQIVRKPSTEVNTLLELASSGRYWARTSDPQLVELVVYASELVFSKVLWPNQI